MAEIKAISGFVSNYQHFDSVSGEIKTSPSLLFGVKIHGLTSTHHWMTFRLNNKISVSFDSLADISDGDRVSVAGYYNNNGEFMAYALRNDEFGTIYPNINLTLVKYAKYGTLVLGILFTISIIGIFIGIPILIIYFYYLNPKLNEFIQSINLLKRKSDASYNMPESNYSSINRQNGNVKIESGIRFCTGCGTSLDPDARFCPNCGKQNE
jgi:hypothetical protein